MYVCMYMYMYMYMLLHVCVCVCVCMCVCVCTHTYIHMYIRGRSKDHGAEWSALHEAAKKGQTDVILVLVQIFVPRTKL
jgi:hypothetical protein